MSLSDIITNGTFYIWSLESVQRRADKLQGTHNRCLRDRVGNQVTLGYLKTTKHKL